MLREPVMYARYHVGFVGLSTLDVLVTSFILSLGGAELNAIANRALEAGTTEPITILTFYKFATVTLVLLAIEAIGRRRKQLGRGVAGFAVMANFVAVGVGVSQLAIYGAVLALERPLF